MIPLAENEHLFTSESVTEGHPDKMADQISDAILDAALTGDPTSRVACETLITTGLVVVAGEITTSSQIDFAAVVRATVNGIGYDRGEYGFDGHHCAVMITLDKQSPDIAQGVDQAYENRVIEGKLSEDELDSDGAGDQGMMFGFACRETPELMPLPIALAHRLSRRLAAVRKDGTLPYLRPDGKTQVTVRYRDDKPVGVEKILISTQHAEEVETAQIKSDLWEHVVVPVIPAELYSAEELQENYYVNPTGRFVIGGPVGDAGLTGRKIIVDTYGGFAAYAARWVAKNIVAAGLADKVEVQVAYAIGVARPLSLLVETFGTEQVPLTTIRKLVDEHFDLRPAAFRRHLQLNRPIFAKTAAYGHFGRDDPDFTWEITDMADALRSAAGL